MFKQGLLLMLTAMLITPAAHAVEALTSVELLSHCDQYEDPAAEEDRVFCLRYIQGFIDGAVATDERVLKNVTAELGTEETFSQRAARTRIGNRLDRFGATVYADYCLGDPVHLKEVVQHVVEDAKDPELVKQIPLARELVYQSLRDHYSCNLVE